MSSWIAQTAPIADAWGMHEILDRRLADGSIAVEEYERRRRLLDDAGSGGGSAPQRPNVLGGQA